MKRLSTLSTTALLVFLAAAVSPVRADYLNWTYTANSSVPGLSVGSTSPSGGATITLTDFNKPQPGGASIPVQAYVTSTSNTAPVSFSNSAFSLALTITDGAKNDSGTLSFNGSVSGSLSATTSSLIASFTPVSSNTLTLDGHTYTVTIPSATLASPTSPQQDIMAIVSVANASGGGSPGGGNPGGGSTGGGTPGQGSGTPEPASLLLGSLGISCLGARYWWRRRRLTGTAATA